MTQSKKTLRLVHGPKSFCDLMIHANIALSSGRPEEAINHYTETLYQLAPAHVCAFLNRSMAYLEGGYYDLAVVDAYRACVASKELRNNTLVAEERRSQVVEYLRVEQLHVDANDRWTMPKESSSGVDWTNSPLASIVVNATPENSKRSSGITYERLISALEIRASYRLCGALFMVGDGARSDALSLIDDTISRLQMKTWEIDWFDKLGNEIMFQIVSEVDPYDIEDLRKLGHDTPGKRDERMTKLKQSMKASTSLIRYGDYPWCPFEPNLGDSDWQWQLQVWEEQLQAWVECCSDNCSAVVIQSEQTENTPAGRSKPYVELRAKQDINYGDRVLFERTVSNVTTSTPERTEAKRHAGNLDHFYCNSCASLLAVPLQCPKKFQTPQTPIQSESPPSSQTLSSPTIDSHETTQVNDKTIISIPAHLGQSPSTPGAPSSSAQLSPHRDLMFCRPNHIIPTCSAACREMGKEFDTGICQTKLEQKLRQSHFNNPQPKPIADRRIHCLRDLTFLRHITMAINVGESPLSTKDIIYATSGPNMRSKEDAKLEPWSYASHVLRPIRYLHLLFENSNTDQFVNLSQVDGWIVNTLLAKISKAMNISKGPRYAKRFREDGTLDAALSPWHQGWEELTTIPGEHEDDSVWIASIDSMFNMIRIADPTKGEVPNVAVVRNEGVKVYAIQRHEDEGPAIRAGKPLLRAKEAWEAEAVEGRPFVNGSERMIDGMCDEVMREGDWIEHDAKELNLSSEVPVGLGVRAKGAGSCTEESRSNGLMEVDDVEEEVVNGGALDGMAWLE